jgi:hypothetical protein
LKILLHQIYIGDRPAANTHGMQNSPGPMRPIQVGLVVTETRLGVDARRLRTLWFCYTTATVMGSNLVYYSIKHKDGAINCLLVKTSAG